MASLLQCFQAFDDRQYLHAVVGGEPEPAGEFLTVLIHHQDSAVAAGAGIAKGGAIRVEGHVRGRGFIGH